MAASFVANERRRTDTRSPVESIISRAGAGNARVGTSRDANSRHPAGQLADLRRYRPAASALLTACRESLDCSRRRLARAALRARRGCRVPSATTSAGARLDEALVRPASSAWRRSGRRASPASACCLAISASTSISSARSTKTSMPGQGHVGAQRPAAATVGPQAGRPARRPSTRSTAPSARSSSAVSASQRTANSICVFGRHVLPAADLADRPQHLLEPGEPGLDLRVLPRGVALGPRGDHDALGRRLRRRRSRAPAPPRPAAATPLRSRTGSSGAAAAGACRACGPAPAGPPAAAAASCKPRLDHLDVEAAELVPGEVVEHPGRVGIAVLGQRVGHLLASPSPAG